MENPGDTEPVSQWVTLIAENGILITIAALVLFGCASYLMIWLAEVRRRKSGDWVAREDLVQAFSQQHPERYLPPVQQLPRLTHHPVFAQWESDLRSIDRLSVKVGQELDLPKTLVLQDLMRAVIRPTRNLWRGIIATLYEDLEKFEQRLGDEQSFRHFVGQEYARLMEITRQQLVKLGLPADVIRLYGEHMVLSDLIADQMLAQAADHPLNANYFRLLAVLDTQLARAISLRQVLTSIVERANCSAYERNEQAASGSTLDFQGRRTPSLGDAMVDPDFNYRPVFDR